MIVAAPETRALHLDEAQLAGAGNAAFDVVAELLELAVGRLEAEAALDVHDDGASAGGARLGVGGRVGADGLRPVMAAIKPIGTTSRPPRTTGGSGEIWASSFSSSSRFCSRPCRSVGAFAGLVRS